MKFILSLAAIAAVAYADADADAKKAVADKVDAGKDTAPLSQAISRPDVELKTGSAAAKATLKQSTGVRVTTGTDGQTYFQYLMEVAPTAAWMKDKSFIDLAFAASKTEAKVDYTQWYTSDLQGTPIVNYKYGIIERSIAAIETTPITDAETAKLKASLWVKFGTIIKASGAAVDENFWDAVAANSAIGDDNSLKLMLERKQPGVEQLKIGGAALVYLKFKDDNGVQKFTSTYAKWANAADSATEDSAFAVSTAAVAVAAIAALF